MQAAVRPYFMAGVGLAGAGLIAAAPIAPPPGLHVSSQAVRLTSGESLLGDLGNIDLTGGISSLFNDVGSLANFGALGDLGGLANVPYNIFADIANIPYYESLALQEYAYALGPAGSVGGVAGWIPPGATTLNHGVEMVNGLPYYALGGTGSYWNESIGNTWGWDDGNWPQFDAISHFLFPFKFEEGITEQIQSLFQSEAIAGSHVNCEFECADVLGYLGRWFQTPLTHLLSAGYTFPDTVTNTVGQDVNGIINVGPQGDLVNWAGQPGTLNPLAPLEGVFQNLTGSPADNPIQLPDLGNVFTNYLALIKDEMADFNPFITGSFAYWGAPTLYSVPALLAGFLQDFTGIQNQFVDIGAWAPNGAEPVWGYDAGPASLISLDHGLPAGFGYLAQGLLGYLNPGIYLTALEHLFQGQFPSVLEDIPLLGFLGLPDPSTLLGSVDPSTLLGSFDPATVLGSFDPATVLGSFDPATVFGSFDPATVFGSFDPTALIADLGSLIPQL